MEKLASSTGTRPLCLKRRRCLKPEGYLASGSAPGSRRGSRTSLLPPGQTRGQYIHPTETIQAVYDLGFKRGLQKGRRRLKGSPLFRPEGRDGP